MAGMTWGEFCDNILHVGGHKLRVKVGPYKGEVFTLQPVKAYETFVVAVSDADETRSMSVPLADVAGAFGAQVESSFERL